MNQCHEEGWSLASRLYLLDPYLPDLKITPMTSTKLNTLAISGIKLSDEALEKLRKVFIKVHYHPDNHVPKEEWKNIEIWYSRYDGFPQEIQRVEDIPRTRAIQLTSGMSSPSGPWCRLCIRQGTLTRQLAPTSR